jgi:hypothetical protein
MDECPMLTQPSSSDDRLTVNNHRCLSRGGLALTIPRRATGVVGIAGFPARSNWRRSVRHQGPRLPHRVVPICHGRVVDWSMPMGPRCGRPLSRRRSRSFSVGSITWEAAATERSLHSRASLGSGAPGNANKRGVPLDNPQAHSDVTGYVLGANTSLYAARALLRGNRAHHGRVEASRSPWRRRTHDLGSAE